jgi:hypothetical protein
MAGLTAPANEITLNGALLFKEIGPARLVRAGKKAPAADRGLS